MTDCLPQLWGFMGYTPNCSMGGGIILRNLLVDYPRENLTIVASERLVADLRRMFSAWSELPSCQSRVIRIT